MDRSRLPAARAYESRWMLVALAGCTVVLARADAAFQDSRAPEPAEPARAPSFAAPVRLEAGDEPMGVRRLYPSPVLRDMDGDGRADVVLGDLWGAVTIAPRLAGDAPAFGADAALKASDGEDLKFSNW